MFFIFKEGSPYCIPAFYITIKNDDHYKKYNYTPKLTHIFLLLLHLSKKKEARKLRFFQEKRCTEFKESASGKEQKSTNFPQSNYLNILNG